MMMLLVLLIAFALLLIIVTVNVLLHLLDFLHLLLSVLLSPSLLLSLLLSRILLCYCLGSVHLILALLPYVCRNSSVVNIDLEFLILIWSVLVYLLSSELFQLALLTLATFLEVYIRRGSPIFDILGFSVGGSLLVLFSLFWHEFLVETIDPPRQVGDEHDEGDGGACNESSKG